MHSEDASPSASARDLAKTAALASAFIPGAGQLVQGRYLAAVVQFITVLAYLVIGSATGLPYPMRYALVWNCYSVFDAYRYRID